MISKPREWPELMAVTCTDCDRRYFICTRGITSPGVPILRERYRQQGNDTVKEETAVDIPRVCETYYETHVQIDRHNRCRQDDFGWRRRFRSKSGLFVSTLHRWKLVQRMLGNCFWEPCETANLLPLMTFTSHWLTVQSTKKCIRWKCVREIEMVLLKMTQIWNVTAVSERTLSLPREK